MKKFQTMANYVAPELPPVDEKLITQPNMALSVKEILNKYAQGGRINGLSGQFTGDVLLPDLRKMDFVDVDDLRAWNKHEVERLTAEHEKLTKKDADRRQSAAARQQKMVEFYEAQINNFKAKAGDDLQKSDVRSDK